MGVLCCLCCVLWLVIIPDDHTVLFNLVSPCAHTSDVVDACVCMCEFVCLCVCV